MSVPRYFIPQPMVRIMAALLLAAAWSPHSAAAEHAGFKDDIFPILQKYCVQCHQPGSQGYESSGLDLRSYEGLMRGTKHGPIVVPGDAFLSNLNVLTEGRAAAHLRMPYQSKKLSRWERHLFRRWVNRGAKDN